MLPSGRWFGITHILDILIFLYLCIFFLLFLFYFILLLVVLSLYFLLD